MNEISIALLDYDTRSEVDAKISGAGFLDHTAGDARYLVEAPGVESGQIFNLVQEQFTPRTVRNLLLEAPLVGDAIDCPRCASAAAPGPRPRRTAAS